MLTHAPGLRGHAEDAPSDSGFTRVDGLVAEIESARSAAGAKDFHLMGRAEIIRQELRLGHVEERSISIGVVEPRSDSRPFEGFDESVDPAPIIRTLQIATRDRESSREPPRRDDDRWLSSRHPKVRCSKLPA